MTLSLPLAANANRWARFSDRCLIYPSSHRLKYEFFACTDLAIPPDLSDHATTAAGELHFRQSLASKALADFEDCCGNADKYTLDRLSQIRARMRGYIIRSTAKRLEAVPLTAPAIAMELAHHFFVFLMQEESELADLHAAGYGTEQINAWFAKCVPWLGEAYWRAHELRLQEQEQLRVKRALLSKDASAQSNATNTYIDHFLKSQPNTVFALLDDRVQELALVSLFNETLERAHFSHDQKGIDAVLKSARVLHTLQAKQARQDAAQVLLTRARRHHSKLTPTN